MVRGQKEHSLLVHQHFSWAEYGDITAKRIKQLTGRRGSQIARHYDANEHAVPSGVEEVDIEEIYAGGEDVFWSSLLGDESTVNK